MLPPVLLSLFFVMDLLETLNELAFVVRVLVFSYLLFWLYMTFRDVQTVFGISVIVTGYLVFVHGVSITMLVIVFVLFVVLGSQLQMLLQFGIMPLLGYTYTGERFEKLSEIEKRQAEMQAAQAGEAEEAMRFQEHLAMARMRGMMR